MITHERLKELIEQGASVYYPTPFCCGSIKLTKIWRIGNFMNELYIFCGDKEHCPLSLLFETEEGAEWHKEFGCIERTERLELPTWEDFDAIKFVWFVDKNQNQCCLHYLNYDNKIVINVSGDVIVIGEITKENYTLACRKAKELFLGESE